MKIKVIASGSKGNCTVVMNNDTSVIIDVGINYQRIDHELKKENIDIHQIDGILITHTHNDHIKGLKVLVKQTNIKVFIPLKMVDEVKDIIPLENIEIVEDDFIIRTMNIKLLHTSHDRVCSVGYLIEDEINSVVYITDTGYINKKILEKIKNKNLYMIESNHDERMLMDGPYPYYLKQRVISDEGHLSNIATAKYLVNIIGNQTKTIILAHISENNNTMDLAYNTTSEILKENEKDRTIILAKQDESLELIEV